MSQTPLKNSPGPDRGPAPLVEAGAAAVLFILLTGVMLYPFSLHLGTNLIEPGDSLLNTWTLAWDVQALTSHPLSFFEANIFFPHHLTLAYSEHQLANALLAWPVLAVSRNPVLAHNLVLYLSFVLSGLGTFLLVRRLTGNLWAALLGGLGFAFCPYRFVMLGHLQMETIHWLPFVFLLAHRLAERPSLGNSLGLTLFYVLQCLSCGYHALFLTVCLGPGLLMLIVFNRTWAQARTWPLLALFGLVSAAVMTPFFYPYLQVRAEMGFVRPLSEIKWYSADLIHYLAAPWNNKVWGPLLSHLGKEEAILFPGLTLPLLAAAGLWLGRPRTDGSGRPGLLVRAWQLALAGLAAYIVALAAWGPWSLGPLTLRRIENPFLLILGLLAARLVLDREFRLGLWPATNQGRFKFLYLVLLIACFLFSLGPGDVHLGGQKLMTGPYGLLLNYVPGFGGLRVPARFGLLVAFFLSLLAGLGLAAVLGRMTRSWLRTGLALVVCGLVLAESWSVPLAFHPRPLPQVKTLDGPTRWLADQPGPKAVLELPLGNPLDEVFYMYSSIFHWHRLVNGYSGNFPKDYLLLTALLQDPPDRETTAFLARTGVSWLIFHGRRYSSPEAAARVREALDRLAGQGLLEPGPVFGPDRVYVLKPGAASVFNVDRATRRPGQELRLIDRHLVEARVELVPQAAGLALDGDFSTSWASGRPQQPGDSFELIFSQPRRLAGLELVVGHSVLDYPRRLKILARPVDKPWTEVAGLPERVVGAGQVQQLRDKPLSPLTIFIDLDLPWPVTALRLVQVGRDEVRHWSIAEIRLFER
ncbi:MAG: hypothetical protein JRJ59_07400 [Deltaproteobacteria bacterium]|nr:hypothetical protein [Deltaproteobacteria bacterium]